MSARHYGELQAAIHATEGYKVHGLIQLLAISFATLEGNERELLERLSGHSDLSLWHTMGVGHRKELDAEFAEVTRLLHNYVASVTSLVDHTRRVAKELLDKEHFAPYQRRVDADFRTYPLGLFLKDLRNVLLHVTHLPINKKMRFGDGTLKSVGIELSPEELLECSGWQKPSLAFINEHKDGIELAAVILAYRKKVMAFYEWLQQFIEEACKPQLDELVAKKNALADFCRQNSIPITDEEWREYGSNFTVNASSNRPFPQRPPKSSPY